MSSRAKIYADTCEVYGSVATRWDPFGFTIWNKIICNNKILCIKLLTRQQNSISSCILKIGI